MPEPFDALAVRPRALPGGERRGLRAALRARVTRTLRRFRAAATRPPCPPRRSSSRASPRSPTRSPRVVFRTSGTTIGARGTHAMRDVGTYDAAALAFGRWASLDGDRRCAFPARSSSSAPPPTSFPTRRSRHMLALFAARARGLARRAPRRTSSRDGVLELAALDARVARALVARRACLVLGTSFALRAPPRRARRRWLPVAAGEPRDADGGVQGQVARGGRRRSCGAILARGLRRRASARSSREYGMTELSSQFYEGTLRDPATPATACTSSRRGRASCPSIPRRSRRWPKGRWGSRASRT